MADPPCPDQLRTTHGGHRRDQRAAAAATAGTVRAQRGPNATAGAVAKTGTNYSGHGPGRTGNDSSAGTSLQAGAPQRSAGTGAAVAAALTRAEPSRPAGDASRPAAKRVSRTNHPRLAAVVGIPTTSIRCAEEESALEQGNAAPASRASLHRIERAPRPGCGSLGRTRATRKSCATGADSHTQTVKGLSRRSGSPRAGSTTRPNDHRGPRLPPALARPCRAHANLHEDLSRLRSGTLHNKLRGDVVRVADQHATPARSVDSRRDSSASRVHGASRHHSRAGTFPLRAESRQAETRKPSEAPVRADRPNESTMSAVAPPTIAV